MTDLTTSEHVKTKYRIIDTEAVLAGLPEVPKDVIAHAAFRTLDEELWETLISDKWVEAFADHARVMLTDIDNQLVEYRQNLRSGAITEELDWERRTVKVRSRVSTLVAWLEVRAKQARQRSLRRAVELHRATVIAEYEPTPADLALWDALQGDQ